MPSPDDRARVADATTRVDLHVKILSERVVRRAKARGLDAVVYAPHFRRWPDIVARAERFSDAGLTVIPGRELFTGSWRDRKHVLALDLEEPVPDFITLGAAMEELSRQDAAVLAPHPGFLTVSLAGPDLRRYRERIDAVETYNPKNLPHHTRRARSLQSELGVPAFASSYAHLTGTVGEAWTEFLDVEPTAGAVIDAIRTGTPRSVEHREGASHYARRGLEFAHLGVENSVEKFDRVVLSGTEDTHPDHPAYGGRFDDASVY